MTTGKATRALGNRIGDTNTLRQLTAAIKRFIPLAPRAGMVWGRRGIEPTLR